MVILHGVPRQKIVITEGSLAHLGVHGRLGGVEGQAGATREATGQRVWGGYLGVRGVHERHGGVQGLGGVHGAQLGRHRSVQVPHRAPLHLWTPL
jgi:hypothetical protein